jgi:hypothetical protein
MLVTYGGDMTNIRMPRENVYAEGPERLERNTMQSRNVTGYEVVARDGRIGTVAADTYETGAIVLVVDTGIFGAKRELPVSAVQRVDVDDHKVYITPTKRDVKRAPKYQAA